MRKFTLTLIAVFMATVSFGQVKQEAFKLAAEKINSLQQLKVEKSLSPVEMRLQSKTMKAPAKVGDDMITEAPEGTKQAYERSGGAWVNSLFGLSMTDQAGWMETVTSEDGKTIYFKDIISQNQADTWVAGTVNADGSITLPMDQNVSYSSSYDAYITLKWTYFAVDAEITTLLGYGYYDEITAATLKVDADGVMTLDKSGIFTDEEGNLWFVGLGLFWTDDDTWAGMLDYGSVYTPGEMPENIPAPEGLVTETYTFSSTGYDGGASARLVDAGWDGDDFWLQGLESSFPDAWVKGTKKGDKVVFETPQFLGFYSAYSIYLVGGEVDEDGNWVLSEGIEMDFDEETKTLSLDEDHAMISNAALDRVYYLTFFGGAKISPYVEVPAKPSTPIVYGFNDYFSSDGYSYITASIPNVGTNGEFLDPEKLTYIVYLNGEPFTFKAGLMPMLSEDMTEIPYTFTDNYDIARGGSYIYPYATGVKTVSIQSIYYGGGEVHASDMMVYETGLTDPVVVGNNVFRGFDGDEDMCGNLGTGVAESYDVATYVQDANLAGKKILGMTVLVAPKSATRTDYQGWLSKSLDLKNGAAVTNVEGQTSVNGNLMTVTFDEPYTIPAEGFFAGYSFTVNDVVDDDDEAPVYLAVEPSENGFFMHTSCSYLSWMELGSRYSNAILPVMLTFEDGTIQEVGARIINTGENYVKVGEPSTINVQVANNGKADIKSIQYTVCVDGYETSGVAEFKTPISGKGYGQQADVAVKVPAIAAPGTYPVTIIVDRVNGIVNQIDVKTDEGKINAVSFVPKHRVLVEEYTGTWCGYCPRGMVGMKMLADAFGEDFVGVAYHNGDPMASYWANNYGYPSSVAGFPSAYINRVIDADPYYGVNNGIVADVAAEAAKFSPVEVEVAATLNADEGTIDATAWTTFVAGANNQRYSVEFIAIENGLSGEDWAQSNYYNSYSPEQLPEGMEWLSGAGSYIEGLEYNDVYLLSTYYLYADYADLPNAVKNDVEYTSTASLPIDYMLNESLEPISQNLNNVEVIAVVLDNTTGEAVNCAKCKLDVDGTSIDNVNADQVKANKAYNLQGIRVNKGYKGMVIMNGKKYMAK